MAEIAPHSLEVQKSADATDTAFAPGRSVRTRAHHPGDLRSLPLFRDAHISEPHTRPGGRVSVEVHFGSSPALFRIIAPCAKRAYAILHELAVSLAGVERDYTGGGQSQGEGGRNGVVDGPPSPGVWTG